MFEVMDVYLNLFLILIKCSKDLKQGEQGLGCKDTILLA